MANLTNAQLDFMAWLRTNYPKVYDQFVPPEGMGEVSGLLDSITSGFTKLVTAAPVLLNQYVEGKQQLALIKLNLSRAKQNLPPVPELLPSSPSVPGWMLLVGGLGALWLLTRKRA